MQTFDKAQFDFTPLQIAIKEHFINHSHTSKPEHRQSSSIYDFSRLTETVRLHLYKSGSFYADLNSINKKNEISDTKIC
jgi:hypothetical protein